MFLTVGFLLVVLDQLTKGWIETNLVPGESLPVLPPLFYFTHVQNPGAAFGLMANGRPFFIAGTFLAAVVVFYKRRTIAAQPLLFQWGVVLSLAGAFGNLIDRVRVGQVVDFIDFRFFWVFNLADIGIVLGVSLMVWVIMRVPEAR